MKLTQMTLVALIAALGWAAAESAQACGPYGYGGGCGINSYTPTDLRPPYFALHPPVYYSHSVARTYGYSPYAYGPRVRTPNPRPVAPVTISNQYLLRSKVRVQETSDKTVSYSSDRIKPAVIENPYFDSQPTVASK